MGKGKATLTIRSMERPDYHRMVPLDDEEILVGRDALSCGIVIPGDSISMRHAILRRTEGGGYSIADNKSRFGVMVNSVSLGGPHLLQDMDEIVMGSALLLYRFGSEAETHFGEEVERRTELLRLDDQQQAELTALRNQSVEAKTVQVPSVLPSGEFARTNPSGNLSGSPGFPSSSGNRTPHLPVQPSSPAERPTKLVSPPSQGKAPEGAAEAWIKSPFVSRHDRRRATLDPYTQLRLEIHEELISRAGFRRDVVDEKLWEQARNIIDQIIHERRREITQIVTPEGLPALLRDVLHEAVGLGPIQDFLDDPEVEEIMVNGPYTIYVVKKGEPVLVEGRNFVDVKRLLTVIDRIVAPLGRPVNQRRPIVDARLANGSRVNVIVEPVSLVGPVLTIRKFPERALTPEDLVRGNALSAGMTKLLRLAVEHRTNIIVAGGTAAGKTTLLNVLSSFIPGKERVITIEDSAELRLQQRHVVGLETRPPSVESDEEITIRDLIRNALRMRPDRIVVGECRGGEAFDMLQAMNSGHPGSMTTGHANSALDMLSRLESMVMMAGLELPLIAIRDLISRSINLVVYLKSFPDRARRVAEILEVLGVVQGQYETRSICRYEYEMCGREMEGGFRSMGYTPRFLEELRHKGVEIPPDVLSHG